MCGLRQLQLELLLDLLIQLLKLRELLLAVAPRLGTLLRQRERARTLTLVRSLLPKMGGLLQLLLVLLVVVAAVSVMIVS
jgi:hypothetical protein